MKRYGAEGVGWRANNNERGTMQFLSPLEKSRAERYRCLNGRQLSPGFRRDDTSVPRVARSTNETVVTLSVIPIPVSSSIELASELASERARARERLGHTHTHTQTRTHVHASSRQLFPLYGPRCFDSSSNNGCYVAGQLISDTRCATYTTGNVAVSF